MEWRLDMPRLSAVGAEEMATVKHIMRTISVTNVDTVSGAESLQSIESYVNGFLAEGFKLLSVHFLGHEPEGPKMLWVLVK